MRDSNMISMKDIAAMCKVSVATVSKALNGHADISEATKERICRVAREQGYFPNSVARALKTNKTNNIGVLFVEETHSGLSHSYFSKVLDSFKVTAEEYGYDITFLNRTKKENGRMTYLEHCRYRGFDGVLIACVNFEDEQVAALIQSDIPIVTIDRSCNERMSIVSDNISGQRELLQYVYDMGHRKIAYIHGRDSAVTRQRLGCFTQMMEQYGIRIRDEYILEADYCDANKTAERTKQLLELDDPPTCIMFPDDFAAYGGMNVIKAAGLSIPQDISVTGYDGISLAKMIEPRLTTLEQDTQTIGAMAAHKLVALIEEADETRIETHMVKGTIVEGETVAKIG